MQRGDGTRPAVKKADVVLVLAALALACAFFVYLFVQPKGGVAVVEQNGRVLYRIDLSRQAKTETLELGGEYEIAILVEPGAVSFSHSGCPDQVCVRTGKLTSPGQTAACLPARVSIRIEGENAAYDGRTG